MSASSSASLRRTVSKYQAKKEFQKPLPKISLKKIKHQKELSEELISGLLTHWILFCTGSVMGFAIANTMKAMSH